MNETEKCCPKCKGTNGFEGRMTETHHMVGEWGGSCESSSGGHNVKWSLVVCIDCGAKFNIKTCEKVGQ